MKVTKAKLREAQTILAGVLQEYPGDIYVADVEKASPSQLVRLLLAMYSGDLSAEYPHAYNDETGDYDSLEPAWEEIMLPPPQMLLLAELYTRLANVLPFAKIHVAMD